MSKDIPLEWGFQLHGKSVYFDANIFIYLLEHHPDFGEVCLSIVQSGVDNTYRKPTPICLPLDCGVSGGKGASEGDPWQQQILHLLIS